MADDASTTRICAVALTLAASRISVISASSTYSRCASLEMYVAFSNNSTVPAIVTLNVMTPAPGGGGGGAGGGGAGDGGGGDGGCGLK